MEQSNTIKTNNTQAIDWELIWARKFRKNLYILKKTGCGYTPIIREMISLNSGIHPKDLEVVKLQELLDSAKDDNLQKTVEALEIFYEKTVPSDLHMEILGEYKATPAPPKEPTKNQSTQTSPAISQDVNKEQEKATEKKKTDNNLQNLIKRLNEEINVRNYSINTQKNYTAAVLKFLERLNPGDMQNWSKAFKEHLIWLHEKQGLAANTVNLHAASITFFFEEVLGVKPGDDLRVRMKVPKSLPRVHSKEKAYQIINFPSNKKHRLLLMLAYGCGLRLGEIRGVKSKHLDFDRKTLHVWWGKGKKDRIVMLDDDLADMLEAWLYNGSGKEFLFEGYTPGKPLSKRTIQKVYENSCRKQGIDHKGGIHSLRHSFATHLLEQGVGLRYIQKLLGHSSSKSTEIYTHVATDQIRNIKSPIAGMVKKK